MVWLYKYKRILQNASFYEREIKNLEFIWFYEQENLSGDILEFQNNRVILNSSSMKGFLIEKIQI